MSANLSGLSPVWTFCDEETIFKVLNVSSYKIDLRHWFVKTDDSVEHQDRQSGESDHQAVSGGLTGGVVFSLGWY